VAGSHPFASGSMRLSRRQLNLVRRSLGTGMKQALANAGASPCRLPSVPSLPSIFDPTAPPREQPTAIVRRSGNGASGEATATSDAPAAKGNSTMHTSRGRGDLYKLNCRVPGLRIPRARDPDFHTPAGITEPTSLVGRRLLSLRRRRKRRWRRRVISTSGRQTNWVIRYLIK